MNIVGMVYQPALEELYSRIISTISNLKNETEDAMFQHESFKEFTKYISQLKTVIEELQRRRIGNPVLEELDSQLKISYEIIRNYKSSSPFLQFLRSHGVLSQLQKLTKEIAATVKLLSSTLLESILDLKSKTDQMANDLDSLQFELAVKTEGIIDEIDKSTEESCRNRDQSIKLILKIAESVGVSVNSSRLQEELTLLKHEKEALEARRKRAEALQVYQLIQLLDGTELARREQKCISTNRGSRNQQSEITAFTCPLCNWIMEDPVAISCGHSFERRAIQERFDGGDKTCPTCREEVAFPDLTPNYSLKNSIEEWKQRNLDFKFQNAVDGIASDDLDLLNKALEDLQVIMENPNYTEKVAAQHGLIPRLVESLRITSVNSKAALKCLCYLAKQSDENKEAIADAGAIRRIVKHFCKGETDSNAAEVLQELSENEAVADKIGDNKDCIPILVSLFKNHNSNNNVSQIAQKVLQNLSSNTHFVIKMAEVGHFKPFTKLFSQGTMETKAAMASALLKMQLNDCNKEFERKKFITTLTQMLSSSSPAGKSACLQCMKKLLAFPNMVKRFLAEQTTIPGLLGVVAFPGTETHLKQAAAEVLTALVGASELSDAQDNSHLQELQTEHNIGLCLNLAASSEASTKSQFLKLLVTVAQKSDEARSIIRSNNYAVSALFASLDPGQPGSVRQSALKLINCIAEDNPTGVQLPASPTGKESAVKALVTILTCSPDINERSMAAGIIGQLPANDLTVDEIICKSDALKAIRQVICELEDGRPSLVGGHAGDSRSLLENSLAALLRYTEPSKPELTRQLSKLELYPSLIRVLSTGSSLAKERSAIALAQLSVSPALSPTGHSPATPGAKPLTLFPMLQLTRQLSWAGCCTARRPAFCSVHGDGCSSSHSFCLVKANAVGPLVRALSETRTRVAEAALLALDTLFNDEGTRADAAKAIGRYQGIQAILNVLEKGDTSAREKALELYDKILSSSEIDEPQLKKRSYTILIQLFHDDALKKKAALVLGKQGFIVEQSSYF